MKINDCVTLQVGLYFVPVCFKLCSHLKKKVKVFHGQIMCCLNLLVLPVIVHISDLLF